MSAPSGLCAAYARRKNKNPSLTLARVDFNAGCMSLSSSLDQFSELGVAPIPQYLNLSRFDEGDGIVQALITNKAVYHKNCEAKFNKSKLKVAITNHHKQKHEDEPTGGTNIRSRHLCRRLIIRLAILIAVSLLTDKCRRAHTFNLDQRVTQYAIDLKCTRLLDNISTIDTVAFELV